MPKAAKVKNASHGGTGKKVIHPNSRAAAAIARQTHRNVKVDKKQKERSQKIELLGEKLKWFHEHLEDDKDAYTRLEVHEMIDRYLHRFDEELEQIEIVNSVKGRSGQQHMVRKNAIEWTLKRDQQEYDSQGLEVPDMVKSNNLRMFREWTGELRFMQNFKLKKFSAADLEKLRTCKDEDISCDDNNPSDVSSKDNLETTKTVRASSKINDSETDKCEAME